MNKIKLWQDWIKDIANDLIDVADNRHVFNEFHAVLERNTELQKGNIFLDYIIANYASAMVSAIFRIADDKKGTASLTRLLREIAVDSRLLNKQWFGEQYEKTESAIPKEIGYRDYENNFEETHHLTQDDIEKDIKAIEQATSKINSFRHKRIAHKDANKSVKINTSFKDLYDTIDALKPLVHKYYLLLTQGDIELESTITYDWERIFREPWEK